MRDIVEELEPGVQEFVPLEVRSKDDVPIAGKTEHGTYYLILSPPQLDCVVIEETDFEKGRGYREFVGERPCIDVWPGRQCTLSATAIANHHFWRGVAPFEFVYFCSNELHERIASEDLEGLDFCLECRVRLEVISSENRRSGPAR